MELIELKCRNCGGGLPAASIVWEQSTVTCPHCSALFAIAGRGQESPATARDPVPLPKGLSIRQEGNCVEITHQWYNASVLMLLGFAIFWNGFMVVWHSIALAGGIWMMSLFGLLHTAVGIGVGYGALAGLVNRTLIRAGLGVLDVRHGPLPWFGNATLATDSIQQIYCREHVHHGKNGSSVTYSVQLVKDSGQQALVKGLTDSQQALYIEQELERFLKIEDRPVRGELSR